MTRFGALARKVDERQAGITLPLLSVSQTRGVLRQSDLSDRPPRADSLDAYKICRRGDIVFNKMSIRAGAMGVAAEDGLVTYHYEVMRPLSGSDARFISYLMKSSAFTVELIKSERGIGAGSDASGVRTTEVPFSVMKKIDVWVPPLGEQRQIAEYLDQETGKIDELITKQEQLVERLAERLSSLLILSTHEPNLPWKGRLRQVLAKLDRSAAAGAETVTAFRDGQVTRRSLRREDGYTFSSGDEGYQGVVAGDLVFHGLDGFAGAVGIAEETGACSPVYHVTKAKGENSLAYIALLLRALGATGFLATQAGNVRQRSVDFRNWTVFARLPIALPEPVEQLRIVGQFRVAQTRTSVLASRSIEMVALLRERRAALISAAVTGKIDVRGL